MKELLKSSSAHNLQLRFSDRLTIKQKELTPRSHRLGISMFFLMHGICFSSWASRIPDIQTTLQLSEVLLGTILFALPLGFFTSLPFAGWLISRIGSKKVVIIASLCYSVALVLVGHARSTAEISVSLLLLGFFANVLNISMNTQAVAVEKLYSRRLMASFHGLWSLAGFVGAAIGAALSGVRVAPGIHFTGVMVLFVTTVALSSRFLISKDESQRKTQPLLAIPDKTLLGLGMIAFCSMMVEGAMFDWSGVYFARVVGVDGKFTGVGYTTFMIAMAAMRFIADGFAHRVGLRRILQTSGAFAVAGLLMAVSFPTLIPSTIGFLLVGIGVSAVVPMVYSAAGRSTTMSAGMAITAVSSLGFLGFLIGPPLIGFVAGGFGLRMSFLALVGMAAGVLMFASLARIPNPGVDSNQEAK